MGVFKVALQLTIITTKYAMIWNINCHQIQTSCHQVLVGENDELLTVESMLFSFIQHTIIQLIVEIMMSRPTYDCSIV